MASAPRRPGPVARRPARRVVRAGASCCVRCVSTTSATGSACDRTTRHTSSRGSRRSRRARPPRTPVSFRQFVRDLDTEARADRAMPWCIEVGGRIVGQVHLFGIVRAAQQSGAAGYWLDESVTGRGIATRALALAVDHALGAGGLHRVEVNIRLDNVPSLRVVERLGLRDEGVRERFLHIDGAWRDHRSFAVTTEDLSGSTLTDRLSQHVTPASCATRLECARPLPNRVLPWGTCPSAASSSSSSWRSGLPISCSTGPAAARTPPPRVPSTASPRPCGSSRSDPSCRPPS